MTLHLLELYPRRAGLPPARMAWRDGRPYVLAWGCVLCICVNGNHLGIMVSSEKTGSRLGSQEFAR